MKVEYIDHMGDDLRTVNAARVSMNKESEWEETEWCSYGHEIDCVDTTYKVLSEKDAKLIKYLAKHDHWTPFAHPQITLRITAPIFVARQLMKHQQGLVVNEVSRRYVDSEPEFYTPKEWRGRPEGSIKQGSSDKVITEEITVSIPSIVGNDGWNADYKDICDIAMEWYLCAIDKGVAPEQARMILPQSMMTSWYWTGSLAAYARVCKQRLDSHAQSETREVAQMIADIIQTLFPVSWKALMEN
jgi:thymidylate synthase (FAD)